MGKSNRDLQDMMEFKNIGDIRSYPKNTKHHPDKQIQQIAASIKKFGFNQSIVVDKDNVVIVGHGRLEAAKLLGLKEVPTIQVNLTEEQAKAYRLADNKLNESEWDMGLAIEELKGLSEEMFDLTGFDKDLLIEPDEKDDIIPENVPARSKLGDLYELGSHRVLCGDSTQPEAVLRLMDGKKADMVFTSPPYNMAHPDYYETYNDNLASEDYIKFNIIVASNFRKYLDGSLWWNLSYNKNQKWEWMEIFLRILRELGLKMIDVITWDKGHGMPVTQKDALTRQYEHIAVFGDEDEHEISKTLVSASGKFRYKKIFRKLTNYWYIDTFKT